MTKQTTTDSGDIAMAQRRRFQPFCEVRVKSAHNESSWEEIRPIAQLDMNIEQARILFIGYYRNFAPVSYSGGEIRINEIGSLQGHYFTI